MDWQIIINIVASTALTVMGWFARILWEADRELRTDLAHLREELPQHYVSKDDYKDDIRDIKTMLERLFDKLDGKADKH